MPVLKYTAVDPLGKRANGELVAASVADLEQRLAKVDLTLISFTERKTQSPRHYLSKISRRDLIDFCLNMESLTDAGVPIVDGLEDLRDSTHTRRMKDVLNACIEDIREGKLLSDALARHPSTFDQLFVGLVRSGEAAGQLPSIFKNLAEILKWQDELHSKTRQILIYPTFVSAVVISAIVFIMVYLVPKLVTFFNSVTNEIPTSTQLLLLTSNTFIAYWPFLLFGPVALSALLWIGGKTNSKVRYRIDGLKLKLWLIGPILEKIILSRLMNQTALLYQSGITIIDALAMNKALIDNVVMKRALETVINDIQNGESIHASFQRTGRFPPLVTRMIKTGETTGRLDRSLLDVSYFYNRDIDERIEKIQALIEPTLTLILAGMLIWVMMSVLGPVWDTIGNLQVI